MPKFSVKKPLTVFVAVLAIVVAALRDVLTAFRAEGLPAPGCCDD